MLNTLSENGLLRFKNKLRSHSQNTKNIFYIPLHNILHRPMQSDVPIKYKMQRSNGYGARACFSSYSVVTVNLIGMYRCFTVYIFYENDHTAIAVVQRDCFQHSVIILPSYRLTRHEKVSQEQG